ncbi:MAG: Integrase-recombinase protein XERCD family [uncultured Campylobacterales bacterium]|uniref:Integrase-recombinase protein XERCD family n=1 Tax=uncultured Campylobacterales bacterium TaxID=352960 RepID=A0A6S6S297_9BACT|nr:MAG: Integrase-recombinase protein XERCD family [uncultured Campylobacterales bacterium]
MKFPLDFMTSFDKTLLFWLKMFIRMKLTTLSNRQVKDISRFQEILKELKKDVTLIKFTKLCKEVRQCGLIGINTYTSPLLKLYNYSVKYGFASMREIDEDFIQDFLAVHTSSLSDASKKNYRMAILGFFKYIDKQNQDNDEKSYIYDFELKHWRGLGANVRNKLPSYMNDDEVKRFLKAIETTKFKPYALAKNRLLIKIILYTGMRVSEALGIKIKDIQSDDDLYIIKITGKGNKQRIAMLKSAYIQKDLTDWLELRDNTTTLLFHSRTTKKLSQPYVSYIMDKILLTAGVKKDKNGAHMLRHTFGTRLYQMNKDLILVQEALGHSDINTSRIYTHFDKDRLKATTNAIK